MERNYFNRFIEFVKNNKILSALFLVSTAFFIFQHYFYLGWDFSAYVINARYLFLGGDYFEVYRAHLMSVFLGIFSIFGKLGEYVYILLASSLFFISSIKLADSLYKKYFYKYNHKKEFIRVLFYLFSFNIFLFLFGLVEGTELLALAFFQLFLAGLISGRISGHFLALAFLSRYNFLMFLPFLFFNKNYKKIFWNLVSFFLVAFPWFLYNFLKWGNWFTSVADSFYLNIFSRQNIAEPFNIFYLLLILNFFMPFFIFWVIGFFKKIFKKRNFSSFKYDLLFIVIFLLILFDFYNTPFKVKRYLFNFILPIAFFSTAGFLFFINKFKNLELVKKIIVRGLVVFFILVVCFSFVFSYKTRLSDDVFFEASQKIEELGFEECKIVSPHWVPVNYYSGNVYYLHDIESSLRNNETVLIFYNDPTYDDTFFKHDLNKYVPLVKTKDYIIIVKEGLNNQTCEKKGGYDSPMTQDSCKVLSSRFKTFSLDKLFLKICNFVNFN